MEREIRKLASESVNPRPEMEPESTNQLQALFSAKLAPCRYDGYLGQQQVYLIELERFIDSELAC